jgi:hypothetical protein
MKVRSRIRRRPTGAVLLASGQYGLTDPVSDPKSQVSTLRDHSMLRSGVNQQYLLRARGGAAEVSKRGPGRSEARRRKSRSRPCCETRALQNPLKHHEAI